MQVKRLLAAQISVRPSSRHSSPSTCGRWRCRGCAPLYRRAQLAASRSTGRTRWLRNRGWSDSALNDYQVAMSVTPQVCPPPRLEPASLLLGTACRPALARLVSGRPSQRGRDGFIKSIEELGESDRLDASAALDVLALDLSVDCVVGVDLRTCRNSTCLPWSVAVAWEEDRFGAGAVASRSWSSACGRTRCYQNAARLERQLQSADIHPSNWLRSTL